MSSRPRSSFTLALLNTFRRVRAILKGNVFMGRELSSALQRGDGGGARMLCEEVSNPTHVDRSQACGQQRVCVCGPRLQPQTSVGPFSLVCMVTRWLSSLLAAAAQAHTRTHACTHIHQHTRPSSCHARQINSDAFSTLIRPTSEPTAVLRFREVCFSIPTSWTRKLADILRRLWRPNSHT